MWPVATDRRSDRQKQERPSRALLARPVSNYPNAVRINSLDENDQLVSSSHRVVNLLGTCQGSQYGEKISYQCGREPPTSPIECDMAVVHFLCGSWCVVVLTRLAAIHSIQEAHRFTWRFSEVVCYLQIDLVTHVTLLAHAHKSEVK